MFGTCDVATTLGKEISFLFSDFVKLSVESFNDLFETLRVLFKLFASLFEFVCLVLSTLNQHIDVLHDFVFGCFRLNLLILLISYQIELCNLLLKLFNLSLKGLILPLDIQKMHFRMERLGFDYSVRRIDCKLLLITIDKEGAILISFMLASASLWDSFEGVIVRFLASIRVFLI